MTSETALSGDPLIRLRQEKLALKRSESEWRHKQAERQWEMEEHMRARAQDFEYLKLTVVLVLVIVVIWYLTRQFGLGMGAGRPGTPDASQAGPPSGKEHFSPYASILTPDISRTDASFDWANNMPYKDADYSQRMNVEFNNNAQAMSSEDKLFDQLNDLVL